MRSTIHGSALFNVLLEIYEVLKQLLYLFYEKNGYMLEISSNISLYAGIFCTKWILTSFM